MNLFLIDDGKQIFEAIYKFESRNFSHVLADNYSKKIPVPEQLCGCVWMRATAD